VGLVRNGIYTERVDLFEPNIYIQFLVQIAGKPSIDNLVLAVKSAFASNEATLSRVVLEKDGTAFYEKMNESACNVTVIQKDWKELIIENERVPFHINQGELMRVFVIPSGEEISLLLMAHHLVGDGKSITYFLEDVMKALSGEKLEYKPLHLIAPDYLPKESALPLFYKLYVSHFNRKWRRSGRNFGWEDYDNIHKTYWKERTSEVIYEAFSVEEINKIRQCAKGIGVTVNSYLTAAFLEANRNNRTIGMPVDARADQNRSMSNQTTGISVDYVYSEKLSFAENARNIHQKVHEMLDHPVIRYFILHFISLFTPTLLDSLFLYTYGLYQNIVSQKLAKVMCYKEGKMRELGISNLTRMDIPNSYGPYRMRSVLFIPPVVSYAKHIIGVLTIEDQMMISYHFMRNTDEVEEREFFQRAIQNIRIRIE
jgi:hypothetical protein